jgi:hypothetical protein
VLCLIEDGAEGETSGSVMAEARMSASTFLASGAQLSLMGGVADCKTPPSTPMDRDSEEEAETSDTTQIKYPLLDLSELSSIPPMPAISQVFWLLRIIFNPLLYDLCFLCFLFCFEDMQFF